MKIHGFIIFILIAVFAASLPAETPWSYSMNASFLDYSWTDDASGNIIQEQMLGLDIRGSAIVKPTGFYYGTYLSFAYPISTWEYDADNETESSDDSSYDLYISAGVPFGYRWAMPNGRSGAYLGGGPAFQTLFKFQDHMNGSGGLFLEFGIESLRDKGVGFSFGTRLVMAWGAFSTDGYTYSERPMVTTSSFFLGLSWKGTRRS